MAEIETYSLSGKRVSETYRGLLHFPKGVDTSLSKQIIYDGNGTPTSLTVGGGAIGVDVSGNLSVEGNQKITGNLTVLKNLTLAGSANSVDNFKFNDVSILSANSPISFRSTNQIETGNLRIRETANNYELIFGNPTAQTPNLFTFKVDNGTSNNLYIKNEYNTNDSDSPFWINRLTGEVNIKKLKTDSIQNNVNAGGKNANRNTVVPGTVIMYAASAAPDGYLKCDGTVYKISDYYDLYSIIKQDFKTLTNFDVVTGFQVPLIPDINKLIYFIKW